MTAIIRSVTVDSSHAEKLATFWAGVLNREVADGASEYFAEIKPTTLNEPIMMFIAVPDKTPGKNAWHLDLSPAVGGTKELAAEKERLLALGASHIHDCNEYGVLWSTFADPEGNQFCVGVHDE